MFVRFCSADQWEDGANHGTRSANPTWEEVADAIISLDGERSTTVGITDKEGSDHYMLVSGQWDGRCLVNSTKDNMEFFSLVDPARSANKVILFVGGQNGEYQERKCVPLAWALDAARHFYETGELSPTMNWVSDY